VRSAESNRERDAEVEHLVGSGRLPKGPCCHLRRFVGGLGSVKKNERPHPCIRGEHPIDHHVAGTQKQSVDRAPR
jgi:hypothetical protein